MDYSTNEHFSSMCGEGNTAGIDLDKWHCDGCGEKLYFHIVIEGLEDVRWESDCCGKKHVICPYIAAYWIEP